jgi:hypothetical protein
MDRSVQFHTDITFTWRVSAHFIHLKTLDGPRKFRLHYEPRYIIHYVVNCIEEMSWISNWRTNTTTMFKMESRNFLMT